jgi:HlyD family secretion protein
MLQEKSFMATPHTTSDVVQTLGLDRSSGRRRRWRRGLALGVGGLLIVIAVMAWIMASNNGTPQYQTQEARRGDLTVTVTATGNLEPTNQVEVGSELSGIIRTVAVDYNDRVKVGQVLAKLDTDQLQAKVLQSKAGLASAQAKVIEAQATVAETRLEFIRTRELTRRAVLSQHELDASEAAFKRAQAEEASAKAAVAEAQATLDANQTALAKAVIHSPINGIVLKRGVEPGQTVAASFQTPVLFTLAEDLTQMELHVDVDEADVGQVREGQAATFTVDAYPDRLFPARITQVRYGSHEVDGVITYETILNVENSDLALRPGMTATAEITVQHIADAILVPNAALRFTPPRPQERESSHGGLLRALLPHPPHARSKRREAAATDQTQPRVWVLRNGRAASIPVTVGATDGVMTEVRGGSIKPGMALLVDTVREGR